MDRARPYRAARKRRNTLGAAPAGLSAVDAPYAALLDASGGQYRVHLKLDTGMHRLGERCEQFDRIANIFHCRSLSIEGVYTHLCVADADSPRDAAFTRAQGKAFYDAVAALEHRGCSCGKIHLLASSGLLRYPELGGAYARVGIALYGVLGTREEAARCPVSLRPVLSLRTRVAVLPIGYADGLPRALSNGRGTVLLHGRKAPIIGRICMDQTIIDVTDIPEACAGDTAVVLGRSGTECISAYDVAEQTESITNEVLSRPGGRPERILL